MRTAETTESMASRSLMHFCFYSSRRRERERESYGSLYGNTFNFGMLRSDGTLEVCSAFLT